MEAHMRLPEGVSALPGRVTLWPYQRGIAEAISDPLVERVTLVKPVRVGFTTLLTGALASYVAKQKLSLQDEDDLEVLSILMTDKEHGFAVTRVEETARELREMQVIWIHAANDLKLEAAA